MDSLSDPQLSLGSTSGSDKETLSEAASETTESCLGDISLGLVANTVPAAKGVQAAKGSIKRQCGFMERAMEVTNKHKKTEDNAY